MTKALDFDRIEYFSEKPDILRNLRDEKTSKTKVIDRLFRDKAELVQRNIPSTLNAQKDTVPQQESHTAG